MNPTRRVTRTSLSLALAAAACLTAPMAFAQSTDMAADPATAQETTVPTTPPKTAQDAAAPETEAQYSANAGATSWNDLDLDMDGRISKSEASAMPALDQVFDDADGNGDGALTSEEYQSYVANQSAAPANPPQG